MQIVLTLLMLGSSLVYSNDAHALRVNLQAAKYFNQAEYDKLQLAIQMVDRIVGGEEFKKRVLNFTYNGQKAFVQNGGQTNQQVYDFLMTGAERWPNQTAADQLMDANLELYTPSGFQSRNVIGYTNQNTLTVWINRTIYRQNEVFKIAMNLVHEWTHKMGFDHDSKATSRRPYSVPYGVGYIVRDIGQEEMGFKANAFENKALDQSQDHE